jgi:hypothetical protein
MTKVNWRRIVLGGFLWVLVFNALWLSAWVLFLRNDWRIVLTGPGRTLPPTLESLAIWLLLTLVGGIFAIWLYAAIRPRYGAGPKTAIYAGFALWLTSGLGPTLWLAHIISLPASLVIGTVTSGLVANVVATVLGAWLYKEG